MWIQNRISQPSEKPTEHIITSIAFQALEDLPIPLTKSQCVLHKHEILICGGEDKRACYSYHTIKNEYNELVDNNNKDDNQITLLSFGGSSYVRRYTLVMKYVSVWSNENEMNKSINSKKSNNCNEWNSLTNNHNTSIIIGRDQDNYLGARAVIGGRNNNLLFITYLVDNISVFDLNTFQFINHHTFPTKDVIFNHCFVSNLENGQKIMKTNDEEKKISKMLLFCKKTGLSIEYNEDNNKFLYYVLPVCDNIALINEYAYVCINDVILFFGGCDISTSDSKSAYKYSIRENKWTIFENALPNPLHHCVAILSEDNINIHVIGGNNDKKSTLSTHMKTKVRIWDLQLVMICCL
ncbi:hypothetical protein RFI_10478 [Reticulomyxa filosa]|uniref:Kelch motif family protein n=1 Tax=Reticulomyxa filosa TaxID=46433 RepID=X6NMM7_RETFI|nr:hypothetical protein RFI_10478 [Reticulomyxa filosa]|eukprot:ETO26657.1 hypothetical protein RFI_10478 [Reticulomyxa filosa]